MCCRRTPPPFTPTNVSWSWQGGLGTSFTSKYEAWPSWKLTAQPTDWKNCLARYAMLSVGCPSFIPVVGLNPDPSLIAFLYKQYPDFPHLPSLNIHGVLVCVSTMKSVSHPWPIPLNNIRCVLPSINLLRIIFKKNMYAYPVIWECELGHIRNHSQSHLYLGPNFIPWGRTAWFTQSK